MQSLEKYIKEGDYGCIFDEYTKNNNLCDRTRRNLVREATNFLRLLCGNHPKRQEKIALAESIIHLFPIFKVSNSKFGGIVSIILNKETYDIQNNFREQRKICFFKNKNFDFMVPNSIFNKYFRTCSTIQKPIVAIYLLSLKI